MKQDESIKQSALTGKPTSFEGITCHGAKFDNIRNTTGARMPSASELREKGESSGVAGKLFSLFKSN